MFPPKAGKPNKGEQMVRYGGYYSNVSRGRRKKEVWPWVTEMVAVAWKHPNVYIEIGAVSPKYIGTPGTGWEPLKVYGNSCCRTGCSSPPTTCCPTRVVSKSSRRSR